LYTDLKGWHGRNMTGRERVLPKNGTVDSNMVSSPLLRAAPSSYLPPTSLRSSKLEPQGSHGLCLSLPQNIPKTRGPNALRSETENNTQMRYDWRGRAAVPKDTRNAFMCGKTERLNRSENLPMSACSGRVQECIKAFLCLFLSSRSLPSMLRSEPQK
jgi:hypothetical protein